MRTPLVLLVRVDHDGETDSQWLPVDDAVMLARHDPDNGAIWCRVWIVADDVNLGEWDRTP